MPSTRARGVSASIIQALEARRRSTSQIRPAIAARCRALLSTDRGMLATDNMLLRAPAPVIRAALGELSGQLLGDMYVVPQRLVGDGYVFTAPDVSSTVAQALNRG